MSKNLNQLKLSTALLLCMVVLFLFQEFRIGWMQQQFNETIHAQETDANVADSAHKTNISILQDKVTLLEDASILQAAQIVDQAETIAYQNQYIKDLEQLVDDYYIELQKAIPYYQFPTTWEGTVLSKSKGSIMGPSGRETYYNLNMKNCIKNMRKRGYTLRAYPYWIRDDGAKMLGPYVMIAANWKIRPLGSIVETSLGWGIVVDTGTFVETYPEGIDIAVTW